MSDINENSPLPDRLARLAARALSGRLVVAHPNGSSEIWIESGRVVRARNPESDRRLAARLVVGGHALASDITKAKRSAKNRPLIEALIERESVRRDVLKSVETAEARYALAAGLAADPEAVSFERDAGDQPPPLLDVDPLDLLAETETFLAGLEAAERFAPVWSVPSLPNGLPAPDVALGPEEWAVVTRVDGVASVATIAEETGFPEAEVALAVFRLSALGLATVSFDGVPEIDAEPSLAYLDEIEIPDVEFSNDAPLAVDDEIPEDVSDQPHYEAPPEFEELVEAVAEAAVAKIDVPPQPEPAPPEEAHVAAFPVPAPPAHSVDAPVNERIPAARRPDSEVDTKALLRELALLARDPDRR